MERNNIGMNRTKLLLLLILAATAVILFYATGCDKLITETVETTIAGNPTAEFSANPEMGCSPLTVTFTNESNGNYQKTVWDFGDGSTDSVPDPVHTYDTPGMYDVKLSIYDTLYTGDNPAYRGQDVELKKRFIVVGPTGGDIIATVNGVSIRDTSLCVGTEVSFIPTDTTIADSVRWNFGDGSAQTTTINPTHVYNSVGVFDVSLTAYIDTCGDYTKVDTGLVHITNCPDIHFVADDTTGCVGLTVRFEDSTLDYINYTDSNGVAVRIRSWMWEFEGGSPSTATTQIVPAVAYSTPGQYTVKLTITDTEGAIRADSIIDYIDVYDTVGANFVALTPKDECEIPGRQFIVKFSPTHAEAFDSLLWVWGDGDSLLDVDTNATGGPLNPVHAYVNPGKYDVGLTVWGHCGDVASLTQNGFVVLSAPLDSAQSGFTVTPASGDTSTVFSFVDTTSGVIQSWAWDFGDGGVATTDSTSHQYAADGDYWVKLTVTNGCGAVIDSTLVTVLTAPAP